MILFIKDYTQNRRVSSIRSFLWELRKKKCLLVHSNKGVLVEKEDKTIDAGGITVDFWIKVHIFNSNSLWIIRYLGIIQFLWIIKVHTFI